MPTTTPTSAGLPAVVPHTGCLPRIEPAGVFDHARNEE